jgi:hypothetical protein
MVATLPTKADFEVIDTVSGSIAGMVVTILVFLAVGFFLLKYGIIRFSSAEIKPCTTDFKHECIEHSGMVKDIGFVATECKSLWLEIKEINTRQMELRSRLPAEYVSKDDLREIQGRLKSIDHKLDRFLELHVVKIN